MGNSANVLNIRKIPTERHRYLLGLAVKGTSEVSGTSSACVGVYHKLRPDSTVYFFPAS
jgi:hypothetical protein